MRPIDLHEQCEIIQGLAPTTPSTTTPDYVSMKHASRLAIVLNVDNGNTVTGSAITLKQATDVAGTSEKALEFDLVEANTDTGAASALTETAVSSDTFTTDTTNAKNLVYVINVKASDLDVANGFDCVRLGTGDAANMVIGAMYFLYPPRYADPK